MTILRTFHHPDHLGSSSWITDNTGRPIQHLHYLPFGEDWVDQRNSSWNAPYTFSGKEKDVETGYGYFGARYYDSGLNIWLSVDPMSDKYPSMSPYNYCANNPVILVDPDGRVIRDSNGNIVYATTGQTGTFQHPSGDKATLEIGYIFADDGSPIQVFKNVDGGAGWNTNCHGTTFSDGQYWLNNDQVPALLKGDGYKDISIDNAQSGDKIVYNGNSNSEHSMTITKTDGTMNGTEVYGQGGLEEKNHTDKANDAWIKPENSKVVRKETSDRIATDKEIKNLNKSIQNE
jgi:RHS repeat-associated protein